MWLKLLRAGPRVWLELAEAQFWLLWAKVLVTIRPRGKLVTDGGSSPPSRIPESEPDPAPAERIGTAISRASRHGLTRPRCLVRSIALQRMLSRHGLKDAHVRFGVRQGPDLFESHAWVEWCGRVIGDDPGHVRTFTPVDDLTLFTVRDV